MTFLPSLRPLVPEPWVQREPESEGEFGNRTRGPGRHQLRPSLALRGSSSPAERTQGSVPGDVLCPRAPLPSYCSRFGQRNRCSSLHTCTPPFTVFLISSFKLADVYHSTVLSYFGLQIYSVDKDAFIIEARSHKNGER